MVHQTRLSYTAVAEDNDLEKIGIRCQRMERVSSTVLPADGKLGWLGTYLQEDLLP